MKTLSKMLDDRVHRAADHGSDGAGKSGQGHAACQQSVRGGSGGFAGRQVVGRRDQQAHQRRGGDQAVLQRSARQGEGEPRAAAGGRNRHRHDVGRILPRRASVSRRAEFDPHGHGQCRRGVRADESVCWWKFRCWKTRREENGIKTLFFHYLNPYKLVCTGHITGIADMQGKKMRTWGKDLPRAVETVGATPVTLFFPGHLRSPRPEHRGLHPRLDGPVPQLQVLRGGQARSRRHDLGRTHRRQLDHALRLGQAERRAAEDCPGGLARGHEPGTAT